MLRLLAKTLLGLILIAGYVAAPFWTAWSIREAMLSGDSQYLERAIDWDNVRETLRQSLMRTALDLPTPAEVSVAETMTAAAPSARPGLWQRLKTYVGTAAVNRAVDRYANARDLPKLFEYRKVYRSYVSDTPQPPKTSRQFARARGEILVAGEARRIHRRDPVRAPDRGQAYAQPALHGPAQTHRLAMEAR